MTVITAKGVEVLASDICANAINKGFWDESPEHFQIPRKLALIHAETSEALEEHRANGVTEAFTEELADIIIRTLDLAAYYNLDIGQVLFNKHKRNLDRPNKHGKRY